MMDGLYAVLTFGPFGTGTGTVACLRYSRIRASGCHLYPDRWTSTLLTGRDDD